MLGPELKILRGSKIITVFVIAIWNEISSFRQRNPILYFLRPVVSVPQTGACSMQEGYTRNGRLCKSCKIESHHGHTKNFLVREPGADESSVSWFQTRKRLLLEVCHLPELCFAYACTLIWTS